jgi:hypothetical protein
VLTVKADEERKWRSIDREEGFEGKKEKGKGKGKIPKVCLSFIRL